MCLIIDANLANLVFSPAPSPDFLPIWNAVSEGRARAVHGGRLSVEYSRLSRVAQRLLLELGRQGKVRRVDDSEVEQATNTYQDQDICSDDPHILGLAHVSGVRLLCSHDQNLHADFTNPMLLQPSGNIYQTSEHEHLIKRHCKMSNRKRRRRKRSRKA
jgi:hypothetical protein